jgi:hypothetical protein
LVEVGKGQLAPTKDVNWREIAESVIEELKMLFGEKDLRKRARGGIP